MASQGLSVVNISAQYGCKNLPSTAQERCAAVACGGATLRSLAGGGRPWPWRNFSSHGRSALRSSSSDGGRRRWRVEAAVRKTYKSFDDIVKNSPVPVLVDFYALWCGPCQLMSQTVLPEVSRRLKGRLQVVKIDTEKYPRLASEHGVQALPTLMLFRKGELLYRFEGALPADQLISQIDVLLSSN